MDWKCEGVLFFLWDVEECEGPIIEYIFSIAIYIAGRGERKVEKFQKSFSIALKFCKAQRV